MALPLTNVLIEDAPFMIYKSYVKAFEKLRPLLVSTPIVLPPNFSLPFEIMCNVSDFAIEAILIQRVNRMSHIIYYARTLTNAQTKYSTTEKELLVVVFAPDKFHQYLLCSKVIMFTDHAALKQILAKNDAKPRLIRWILLL